VWIDYIVTWCSFTRIRKHLKKDEQVFFVNGNAADSSRSQNSNRSKTPSCIGGGDN
jgi:hypothetical protein